MPPKSAKKDRSFSWIGQETEWLNTWPSRAILCPLEEASEARDMIDSYISQHMTTESRLELNTQLLTLINRNLHVANWQVRANAVATLGIAFPIFDDVNLSEDERAACMTQQLFMLRDRCNDKTPEVRVASLRSTGQVLVNFWSILPPEPRVSLLSILLRLAEDRSSTDVRKASLLALQTVASDSKLAPSVAELLPRLIGCLDDPQVEIVSLVHEIVEDVRPYLQSELQQKLMDALWSSEVILSRLALLETRKRSGEVSETEAAARLSAWNIPIKYLLISKVIAPDSTALQQQAARLRALAVKYPLAVVGLAGPILEVLGGSRQAVELRDSLLNNGTEAEDTTKTKTKKGKKATGSTSADSSHCRETAAEGVVACLGLDLALYLVGTVRSEVRSIRANESDDEDDSDNEDTNNKNRKGKDDVDSIDSTLGAAAFASCGALLLLSAGLVRPFASLWKQQRSTSLPAILRSPAGQDLWAPREAAVEALESSDGVGLSLSDIGDLMRSPVLMPVSAFLEALGAIEALPAIRLLITKETNSKVKLLFSAWKKQAPPAGLAAFEDVDGGREERVRQVALLAARAKRGDVLLSLLSMLAASQAAAGDKKKENSPRQLEAALDEIVEALVVASRACGIGCPLDADVEGATSLFITPEGSVYDGDLAACRELLVGAGGQLTLDGVCLSAELLEAAMGVPSLRKGILSRSDDWVNLFSSSIGLLVKLINSWPVLLAPCHPQSIETLVSASESVKVACPKMGTQCIPVEGETSLTAPALAQVVSFPSSDISSTLPLVLIRISRLSLRAVAHLEATVGEGCLATCEESLQSAQGLLSLRLAPLEDALSCVSVVIQDIKEPSAAPVTSKRGKKQQGLSDEEREALVSSPSAAWTYAAKKNPLVPLMIREVLNLAIEGRQLIQAVGAHGDEGDRPESLGETRRLFCALMGVGLAAGTTPVQVAEAATLAS